MLVIRQGDSYLVNQFNLYLFIQPGCHSIVKKCERPSEMSLLVRGASLYLTGPEGRFWERSAQVSLSEFNYKSLYCDGPLSSAGSPLVAGRRPPHPECPQSSVPPGIMLSEISQTEKNKYWMISLICGIKIIQQTSECNKREADSQIYRTQGLLVRDGAGNRAFRESEVQNYCVR